MLSTSVTGSTVAKSADAPETAGAFTVTMAQPRRISGAFRFTVEDAARLSGMEEALRQNIGSVLSDELDNQAVNGSGSGDGTLNGLFNILTDPTAPAAGRGNFRAVCVRGGIVTSTGCSRSICPACGNSWAWRPTATWPGRSGRTRTA